MKKARYPRRIVKGRKAQVQETQLNWIFILIVGVVILGFFTFIVMKQKTASEAKFSGKVSQQINTILVGAKVSSGTAQVIPTPDLEIRFTCNDYYIGPASQRLGNRVVFAPEYLDGDELITWALDWAVPFKVSTFLYMTTPFIKYIVVGDGATAQKIYDTLPDKLNKVNVSYADYMGLADANDKHVRFIFVEPESQDPPATVLGVPSELVDKVDTITGVVLQSKSEAPANGAMTAKFLKATPSGFEPQSFDPDEEFVCLEDELMFGAIFSDKYDSYDCLVQRAYQRLNIISQIYKERLNHLADSYEYSACFGKYNDNQFLDDMITATDITKINSGNIDYGTLSESKSSLREDNNRLQLWSCALIY